MQIHPGNQTYTDTYPSSFNEALTEYERLAQADEQPPVVAVSNSKEQLRRLQDDLRKLGYRKTNRRVR